MDGWLAGNGGHSHVLAQGKVLPCSVAFLGGRAQGLMACLIQSWHMGGRRTGDPLRY